MLLYSLIALGIFLVTFMWQHIARKYGWKWKPSYMLDLVTEQLVRFFSWVGRIAVWISSFYTYIDLKDLYATFAELYKAVVDFLFSWKAFFESYISDMKLYDHPYLITMGSITLVGGVIYIIYIYRALWVFQTSGNFIVTKGNQLFEYVMTLRHTLKANLGPYNN